MTDPLTILLAIVALPTMVVAPIAGVCMTVFGFNAVRNARPDVNLWGRETMSANLSSVIHSAKVCFPSSARSPSTMTPSTSTRDAQLGLVESLLDSLVRNDLDQLPIAPEFTAQSPLTARLTGQAALDYLEVVAQAVTAIRIGQHIVEGQLVPTIFEEDTANVTIPVFSRFEIEEGRTKDVRVFYDSRRLTPPESGGGQSARRSTSGCS